MRGKKRFRDISISNYEFEKEIIRYLNITNNINNQEKESQNIKININGEERTYQVSLSEEKYTINAPEKHKNTKGSKRNYLKENETKITNGKIGEQIILKFEKNQLKKWGLEDRINEVKLLSQLNEEITFDGLGYDLISLNEFGERICIEVKTSVGKKDKSFFISKKEIEIMHGYKEEFKCDHCFIYYVLINKDNVTIKKINYTDFETYTLEPILYKIKET